MPERDPIGRPIRVAISSQSLWAGRPVLTTLGNRGAGVQRGAGWRGVLGGSDVTALVVVTLGRGGRAWERATMASSSFSRNSRRTLSHEAKTPQAWPRA